MTKGRKPDIVCIGAQKAGTTWLHNTLGRRSDVWVPPFKELHFFDNKFIEECREWATGHVKRGLKSAKERHIEKTPEPDSEYLEHLKRLGEKPMLNGTWYQSIFSRAPATSACLDVTPEYSCIGDEGIQFFKKFLPNSKLIYLIRHPYDRLVSQFKMNASRKMRRDPEFDDWQLLLDMSAMATRGDYMNHIPLWDTYFTPDQLLYLPYGMIRSEPLKLLRKIEDHCELSEYDYPEPSKVFHKTAPVFLPQDVLKILEERTAPQVDYITSRFGSDFLKQSR